MQSLIYPLELHPKVVSLVSIASSYACRTTCNSCATSCIITYFHAFIFSFSTWRSWVAICLIAASAVLPDLIVERVSCLVLNCFATFPVAALRTLRLTNWFLSASTPAWHAPYPHTPP